jgi:signal transduction histidine kinase
VLDALGLPQSQYALASLRYDLSKLRAKHLLDKLRHSRRYRLANQSYSICVLFLKLFERIYAPLTGGLPKPFAGDRNLAVFGDQLPFTLVPAFYQTIWFRVLVVCTALLLSGMVFQMRLRAATALVESHLGDRFLERDRIARELHDTLLQGFQGLLLTASNGDSANPRSRVRKRDGFISSAPRRRDFIWRDANVCGICVPTIAPRG